MPDRFALYEACVQAPGLLVPMLRAIHGGEPRVLGEDFCGTAALSRRWVRDIPGGRAVAVDHDPEPLARARGQRGVRVIEGDVVGATSPERDRADVVFVGNFSIGEWHERAALVRYLRHAAARLRPGGVFVCDTYGGASAFVTGHVHRDHDLPDGSRVRYTWQQRSADPLTGLVENALHFRVTRAGELVGGVSDAFVYRWRLWGVPELRDALRQAGLRRTDVYAQVPDAYDQDGRAYLRPIEDASELDESFIVCVAGRRDGPAPRRRR